MRFSPKCLSSQSLDLRRQTTRAPRDIASSQHLERDYELGCLVLLRSSKLASSTLSDNRLMKRLLFAAVASLSLGACHLHSAAWVAKHADDKVPTKVVADTQPVVRQEGEAKPVSDRETPSAATKAMTRASIAASDGRTVGMFLMANDVNLSFAKIAYANAASEDVKGFARRVLTDHTQIVATIRALIADQDMSPSDDDAAKDLRDFSTLQRDSLRALSGRAFDSTYISMELERHRAMLTMIDDVLLPRARSSELREMLASTRPIIAAHVAHAEQLLVSLEKR
jgi:putative membrane protein